MPSLQSYLAPKVVVPAALKTARQAGWSLTVDGSLPVDERRVILDDDYGHYLEVETDGKDGVITFGDLDFDDLPQSVIRLINVWLERGK